MKNKKQIIFLTVLVFLFISMFFFQRNNKKTFWQIRPAKEIVSGGAFDGKHILIPIDRNKIQAIDHKSGKINWQFEADTSINSGLTIINNGLFFITENQNLFSLNLKSGKLIWKKTLDLQKNNLQKYKKQLLLSQAGGRITLMNTKGDILWENFLEINNTKSSDQNPNNLEKQIFDWEMYFSYENDLIYITFENSIYKLNGETGELIWSQHFEKGILSKPQQIYGDLTFIDGEGNLTNVDTNDGRIVWQTQENFEQITELLEVNNLTENKRLLLNIIDQFTKTLIKKNLWVSNLIMNSLGTWKDNLIQSNLLALNQKGILKRLSLSGEEKIWELDTELDKPQILDTKNKYILIADQEMILAVNLDGYIVWQQEIPHIKQLSLVTKPAYKWLTFLNKSQLLINSFEKNIYALDRDSGEILWQFNSNVPISSNLMELPNTLLVITNNGIIYQIDKFKGTISEKIKIKHQVKNTNIKDKEIFTIDFFSKKNYFTSPFYQVKINCNFASPKGQNYPINGFYYDYNHWQVRFNPKEIGGWQWACVFQTPESERFFSGEFYSEKKRDQFIKISEKSNGQFLTLDGEKMFFPLGLNQTIIDFNQNGIFFDDFAIGEDHKNRRIQLDEYLDVYFKDSGFNTFRWNPGNYQFSVASMVHYPENDYSLYRAGLGDYLLENLYQRDIQVYLTLFAWGLPFGTTVKNLQEEWAINHYLEYMVARYGAYTSAWELTNEGVLEDATAHKFLIRLKSLDPEKLVSISFEKPNLKSVDIISPHWYSTSTPEIADTEILEVINKFEKNVKPIIFGEIGNGESSWDKNSALIMRVRTWVSLFNGAGLIFWNQSNSKSFYNEAMKNANQYIGEEERTYMKVISDFSEKLDAALKPTNFYKKIGGDGVRTYGLASEKELLIYAYHHYNQYTNNATFTINIDLPKPALLEWVNPQNGEVVSSYPLQTGSNTIISPEFREDLVLKISLD